MNDQHQRKEPGGQRELRLALVLTAAMMVIELMAGWLTGSLALIADAGHMLTDTSALALSLFAAWFSTRPATPEKTYGYYRTEILAALANGMALWMVVVWIYVRAFQRLLYPVEIQSGPMLIVAVLGLIANLLSARILSRAKAASLNVRGAWLNVISDALGSIGVIIAGLLIWRWGWKIADTVASFVIGVLIWINAWQLVTQSVNILLEGVPGHLRIPEVVQLIRQIPGVQDVHDVHVWTITTGMESMSGHVIIDDVANSAHLLSQMNDLLARQFGIRHTTFQLEPQEHACQMASD